MSWRHRVAIVVMTVFVGLPFAGTVCAISCDMASSPGVAHHRSGQKCEEPAGNSNGPQLSGVSAHDCSTHDAAIRQLATTAPERADVKVIAAPMALGIARATLEALPNLPGTVDYRDPPGTAPPTKTPLVLRV